MARKTTAKAAKKRQAKPAVPADTSLPPGMTRAASNRTAAWTTVGSSIPPPQAKPSARPAKSEDLLLVCLQDPFDGIGSSAKIVEAEIAASDHDSNHQWRLRSVMEMHPPRFYESWATRGSFTLDLTVQGSASEAAGQWGGEAGTRTGTGTCRVMVMRDADHKIRVSLVSGARHAAEVRMPRPDTHRFLNADVGFELNGKNGLTAGAVAVISDNSWSRLIAGSAVTTKGLAFDGKWRSNLEKGDGDATAQGSWAFAVMSRTDYAALCRNLGWQEHVDG
jgi:hypothetical protein